MHGRLSCMCVYVLSVATCVEWALLPLLAKAQRRRQKLIELLIARANRMDLVCAQFGLTR